MNERAFIQWLLYGGAVAFCLALTFAVLTSNQNLLSTLILYFIPGLAIMGLTNPRLGFYTLIFLSAYIELYKKLSSIAVDINGLDVIIILALSPVLMASIAIGLLYQLMVNRDHKMSRLNGWLFVGATMITLMIFVNGTFRMGFLQAARYAANGGIYVFMAFVIPILFVRSRDIGRLLFWMTLIYIPVALYGFWQMAYGFADFEMDYILRGYTKLVRDYYLGDLRVFSTLTDHSSFAYVMMLFSGFCLTAWIGREIFFDRTPLVHLYIPLFLIFAAAGFGSIVRSSYIVLPLAITGLIMFRRKWTTILFYTVTTAGFLLIVFSSEYILDNLEEWQFELNNLTGLGQSRVLSLLTFSERLRSYQYLTEWESYAPFGKGGLPAGHDALTNFLFSYGYVPLLIIFGIATAALYWIHSFILDIQDRSTRAVCSLLLSLFGAVLFADIIFGGVNQTFPINLYWWLSLGCLLVLLREARTMRPPAVQTKNVTSSEEAPH